jgi:hypothetical protein
MPKVEATDFRKWSRREIIYSFCLVTSLFFLWGFSPMLHSTCSTQALLFVSPIASS